MRKVNYETKADQAVQHLIAHNTLEQIQAMPANAYPAMERGYGILTVQWADVREAALLEKIKEMK